MGQRQLDRLLDLLDLRLEPANVRVRLQRRLVDLHHGDHRVGLVGEEADDRVDLVVGAGAARSSPARAEFLVHGSEGKIAAHMMLT